MKAKSVSFPVVLFLFALGIALLSGFGPTTLNCQKTDVRSTNCQLTKSIALGLVKTQEIQIHNLTAAALDTQIDEILVEKNYIDSRDQPVSKKELQEISVYGVRLIGDSSTLFNGYSRSVRAQKRNIEIINSFLASSATQLALRETPHGHHAFALGAMGLAIVILFRTRG